MENNNSQFSVKKLFRGASIYSVGEILVKASGFFLIPIYTRVLTPSDYGVVGYLQVILQIFTVVLAFGFHGAQSRYYYDVDKDLQQLGRFSFSINISQIILFMLIAVPVSIIGFKYSITVGKSKILFYPFVLLTIWTALLQVLANNAVGYYRASQQFTRAAILQLLRFIFITGFSLYFVLNKELGALGRVFGLFLGMFVFIIISFWNYTRVFVFQFSFEDLKYALGFGTPLVIHLLAGTIHTAIDRVILERYVSMGELGIYSLAFNIGNVLNMFIISFNQAYQPTFFDLMSSERTDKKSQIIKIFSVWLWLLTIIVLAAILIGPYFLKIFAGENFVSVIEVFPFMIISFFFGGFYYFFATPLFYYKKTKLLPIITIISSTVNIILNILFIPQFGIIGAAVATIISHVVQSLIALILGNRMLKIEWPVKHILSSILLVLSALAISIVY